VKKQVASVGIVATHASFAVIGFLLLVGGTFHLI
jgi:hypothetical protein